MIAVRCDDALDGLVDARGERVGVRGLAGDAASLAASKRAIVAAACAAVDSTTRVTAASRRGLTASPLHAPRTGSARAGPRGPTPQWRESSPTVTVVRSSAVPTSRATSAMAAAPRVIARTQPQRRALERDRLERGERAMSDRERRERTGGIAWKRSNARDSPRRTITSASPSIAEAETPAADVPNERERRSSAQQCAARSGDITGGAERLEAPRSDSNRP